MNLLDALAVGLFIVAAILGWRSGALPQLAGLAGAVAGGAVAILALPHLIEPLSALDPAVRPFVVLIGLVLAVAVGESLGAGIGRSAARRLGSGILSAADRAAGSALGVAQAVLIIWLVGGLLAEGPMPRLAETAGGSTAVRTIAVVLPPPTELAIGLGRILDATGLPDVFVGFEPLPAPPVELPDDPTARAIAAVAQGSTFKVAAATCGRQSIGTGFAIASSYVVTNAHVVAGSGPRGVRVTTADGRLHDATAVLFDPELDVALLRVDGLLAVPLAFARRDPDREAIGATLGFPGGGPLTVVPAAVADRYHATGLDIGGTGRVRREILELRAVIDRGDSGGPFVLEDGTVGGVVFAEARTNPDVGYALTASSVWGAVRLALGKTAVVETGDCVG